MPEILQKLRPDRDLLCYFERPSAIAALSACDANRFTISGAWRQQFDWAVLEWNRDNTFEHPMFRNLPDGDLSGIVLTYEETRSNCMAMDCSIFPTVDWPYLRIWSEADGVESFHRVLLRPHATPIEGSYSPAWAEFTLGGSVTDGDYVGLAWFEEQYNHQATAGQSLDDLASALATAIDSLSPTMSATAIGATIRLTSRVFDEGANGNRIGVYGFVSGDRTESWSPKSQTLSGGESPTKWRIQLDFSDLWDEDGVQVPTTNVRKMRWTYAADFQRGEFERSEFEVNVTEWSVSGSGLTYKVAGPGSRRLEDDWREVIFDGDWSAGYGNFSGGSISISTSTGSSVSAQYVATGSHRLYLGTRRAAACGSVDVVVDGGAPRRIDLLLDEDVLVRYSLGDLSPGAHSVSVTHAGPEGASVYFDFLEIANPTEEIPVIEQDPVVTLATDWDTDHSLVLAPERTLWNMTSLGFMGRINHYVGALWYYELVRAGHSYASLSITFSGTPSFGESAQLVLNQIPSVSDTVLSHPILMGETADDVALAFALRLNSGYTGVRAEAVGNVLTIFARAMGDAGNHITAAVSTTGVGFDAIAGGSHLEGGEDGEWRTDLTASPSLNRAARDWTRSFCQAARAHDLDIVCAFSMELQHGDPSEAAGIAQRYPSGAPVLLTTPALQTNFSPVSTMFWRDVYRDMAAVMDEAGCVPYLQFGEVQWWYFPYDGSGLPFADAYTKERFETTFGFPIRAIPDGYADPALYPEEASFLATLIGEFTTHIMDYVRASYPTCRFEVLYPPDVNEGAFNQAANYPAEWNPSVLDCLKTESFTYTYIRDLNKSWASMSVASSKGFQYGGRSHLVGLSDAVAPWLKEVRLAKSQNMDSIVLFALDQFCLIGYPAPLTPSARTSREQG